MRNWLGTDEFGSILWNILMIQFSQAVILNGTLVEACSCGHGEA